MDNTTAEKVNGILEVIRSRKALFFPQALEYFYTQAGEVLKENELWKKTKLSSGISSADIFDFYKELINRDIANGIYKKYTDPAGDLDVRYCLSTYSNLCIAENSYTREDFCLTDGVTGGIASFLEWYSQAYKGSQVIIPCPSYYLAKLGCNRLGLQYKEVSTFSFDNIYKNDFPTFHAIEDAITEQVKLIIITNPSNPTGKFLENEEVDRIIKLAKQKNIILLIDSIFLGLHLNSKEQFACTGPLF